MSDLSGLLKKVCTGAADTLHTYFLRRGPFLARGIAFSFLLGTIPLLVIMLYGASTLFSVAPQLRLTMELRLDELLPANIASAIQQQAREIASHSWTEIGLVTLVFFIFIAQGIFASIEGGLSIIMRCPQERHLWLDNVTYILLTLLAIMLFFAASYVHMFIILYSDSAGWPLSVRFLARKTTSLTAIWLALITIYRTCYHGRIRTAILILVSLAVASLWQLLNFVASSIIAATGEREFIYGFLASVVVFLLWAYFFAVLLLLGGIVIARFSKTAGHEGTVVESLTKTKVVR